MKATPQKDAMEIVPGKVRASMLVRAGKKQTCMNGKAARGGVDVMNSHLPALV